MASKSTRSVEDFPAKAFLTLVGAKVSPTNDPLCGESSLALLAKFDPASSSWKTASDYEPAVSAEFLETWPRSGMMRHGIAYRRPPLARVMSVTGYGSRPIWPTPRADGGNNAGGSNSRKAALRRGTYVSGSINPNHREWLMGYPDGWTEITPSETQSYRRSRKCSEEPGCRQRSAVGNTDSIDTVDVTENQDSDFDLTLVLWALAA